MSQTPKRKEIYPIGVRSGMAFKQESAKSIVATFHNCFMGFHCGAQNFHVVQESVLDLACTQVPDLEVDL